jgi:hypothetical protein
VPVRVVAVVNNGNRMDIENLWLYEFRDGKLARLQVYADTAVAVATANAWLPIAGTASGHVSSPRGNAVVREPAARRARIADGRALAG